MDKKGITVFDFDGTLTRKDTLILFAYHVLGQKRARRAILRSLPAILRWKLGLLTNSEAKETLFGHLFRGIRHADFTALGESFAPVIDRHLRSNGFAALTAARERGDEIVIDSASMEEWIAPWAHLHGVDRVIATRPETDADGRLTGRFATLNCHGPEKVRRFQEEYPDRDHYTITAYGDSSGDRDLLAHADNPHLLKHRDRKTALWFLLVTILLILASYFAVNQYFTTPPYVDAQRFPVRGIDISSHNGMMNLDAAAGDGIEFVFIKASEGIGFRDPNFAINYSKAGHAGLKRGAYHFFRFDRDGVEQAINLLRVIGNRKLELGIALDVEEHGNPADVPTDSIQQRLQDMVDFLNLKGYRITFYTNEAGYERYLYQNFRGFPLWICSFSDDTANDDFTYWQFNHRGKVAGIRGNVDLNAFGGNRRKWQEHLDEIAK